MNSEYVRPCPLINELFAFRIDWHKNLPFLDEVALAPYILEQKVYIGQVEEVRIIS